MDTRWTYNRVRGSILVSNQPFSKLEAIHKIGNNDTGRNNDNTNHQQQIGITATPVNNRNNSLQKMYIHFAILWHNRETYTLEIPCTRYSCELTLVQTRYCLWSSDWDGSGIMATKPWHNISLHYIFIPLIKGKSSVPHTKFFPYTKAKIVSPPTLNYLAHFPQY